MSRALIGITFLVAAATAHATTMLPLDVRALTERADRVLYATVESSQSHWTPDHDAIYTDVTLRAQRSYKGAVKVGETIVVRREGGSVDGIGMKVFGAAQFSVGEEVVLFVEKRGAASWVVGMAQGKLRVLTLADGTRQVAAPDLTGIALLPSKTVTPPVRTRPLEELEREIRAYARGGAR